MPGYWNAHSDRDWQPDMEPDDESGDEYDEGEECGRWNNGTLTTQCENAGTEFCDWICPIGLPHRKQRKLR